MKNFMEININCDLGEKSEFHSTKYDADLLKIVNSANIACGFHAGDEKTMRNTIEISKQDKKVFELDSWLSKTNKIEAVSNDDFYLTINKKDIRNLNIFLKYEGPIKAPIT